MADIDNKPIKSPCIDVCLLDNATQICTGCYRSLDDIGAWGSMTREEQLATLKRAKNRRIADAALI